MRYHVDHEAWRGFYKPLWLAAALVNSVYSYYWDVERDWEISFFSQMGAWARGAGRADGQGACGQVPCVKALRECKHAVPFLASLQSGRLPIRTRSLRTCLPPS